MRMWKRKLPGLWGWAESEPGVRSGAGLLGQDTIRNGGPTGVDSGAFEVVPQGPDVHRIREPADSECIVQLFLGEAEIGLHL